MPGFQALPSEMTRVPFSLPLLPRPKPWAGAAGRGFRALTLASVPRNGTCV
jgi:hypothetical protein